VYLAEEGIAALYDILCQKNTLLIYSTQGSLPCEKDFIHRAAEKPAQRVTVPF